MTRSIKKWLIRSSVVAFGLVLLDSIFLEKYFFQVKTFNIGSKHSNKKIKLLLITDLHFQKTLWPFYARLARKINELAPDLVMIAGDMLDSSGTLKPVDQFFKLIQYTLPKVAILGNHDYMADVANEDLKALYQSHNCTLLVNESKVFNFRGSRLMVTGLDDFIKGRSHFEDAIKDIGREDHHILLIHSPGSRNGNYQDLKR